MEELFEQLKEAWPPIFPGTALNDLTAGALIWETVQNKRCNREIPADVFVKAGPKTLVLRDRFLAWWIPTLLPPAKTAKDIEPPRPRAGRRQGSQAPPSAPNAA
jgi:hypothetical protein